jgi:hypothetical protein
MFKNKGFRYFRFKWQVCKEASSIQVFFKSNGEISYVRASQKGDNMTSPRASSILGKMQKTKLEGFMSCLYAQKVKVSPFSAHFSNHLRNRKHNKSPVSKQEYV